MRKWPARTKWHKVRVRCSNCDRVTEMDLTDRTVIWLLRCPYCRAQALVKDKN